MEPETEIHFKHGSCKALSPKEIAGCRRLIERDRMCISTTKFKLFEPMLNFSGVGFLIKAVSLNAAGLLGYDRMATKGKMLSYFDCEQLTNAPFDPIDFRKMLIRRVDDMAIRQVVASPSRHWVLTLISETPVIDEFESFAARRLENMTSPYAILDGFRHYGQPFAKSVLFSDPSDAMVFKLAREAGE